MHRTTLMLPAELKAQAQQRARELGLSLGALVRRALETELSETVSERRSADPLFADRAVFHGATEFPNAARDHDDYLYGDDPL